MGDLACLPTCLSGLHLQRDADITVPMTKLCVCSLKRAQLDSSKGHHEHRYQRHPLKDQQANAPLMSALLVLPKKIRLPSPQSVGQEVTSRKLPTLLQRPQRDADITVPMTKQAPPHHRGYPRGLTSAPLNTTQPVGDGSTSAERRRHHGTHD